LWAAQRRTASHRTTIRCPLKKPAPHLDNLAMTIFYWTMGVLIVGTLVPSVLFLLLYMVTGAPEAAARASVLWNFSRVLTLAGVNLLIWGHVVAGLWRIWFPS
jgi:hypothetical protein